MLFCQVQLQHADIDRQMAPLMSSVPQWAVPEEFRDKLAPPRVASEGEVTNFTKSVSLQIIIRNLLWQILKVRESEDKFEVSLDVSQYRPEELKVSTTNNMLNIEGKREEITEDGQCSSSVSKQFSRKWTLPDQCR